MKRIYEPIIICVCLAFMLIQVVFYCYNFPWGLSSRSEDWAAFSTFFGLSLSFASALFIYLTYRSQTTMSSVLQFESIFFQWYQQHQEIGNSLKKEISNFSSNVALPFFEQLEQESKISHSKTKNDSVRMQDDSVRIVIPYYRSLYQLMKYIQQNEIIDIFEQKKKYVDIIQSQMTDAEYLVVLYFLLTDPNKNRKDKFEKYSKKKKETSWMVFVDKYHLLKNIYYSSTTNNFANFVKFMQKNFPDTTESFHFLKL